MSDLEAKLGVGAHNNSNPGAEARIPPNGTSLRIDPHKIPGITPSSIADLPAGQVNAVLPSIANPNAVARQPPNGTLVRTEPYNATGRTPTTSAVKTAEWASAIKEYFLNTSNQKKASPGGANSGGSTASVANAMVGTDSEDYARIMNVLGIYVKN